MYFACDSKTINVMGKRYFILLLLIHIIDLLGFFIMHDFEKSFWKGQKLHTYFQIYSLILI